MAERLPDMDPAKARAYAQAFIISGAREGISGAEIYRTITAAGIDIAQSTFYRDYARYRSRPGRVPLQSNVEFQSFLADRFTSRESVTSGKRYQYSYIVKGMNLDTGEEEQRFISTVANKPLIPIVAFAQARNLADWVAYRFSPDFSRVTFDSVYDYTSKETI